MLIVGRAEIAVRNVRNPVRRQKIRKSGLVIADLFNGCIVIRKFISMNKHRMVISGQLYDPVR